MTIDYDALDAANITFPTKKIPVPELKSFFKADEDPVWEIKSLTGAELAVVNEAAETVKKTKTIIDALASGSNAALKKGMETFLNKNADTDPEDLIRRHKMLEFASIPPCPEHICVRLAHAKPTIFYRLTNEIIKMTGDGASLGE